VQPSGFKGIEKKSFMTMPPNDFSGVQLLLKADPLVRHLSYMGFSRGRVLLDEILFCFSCLPTHVSALRKLKYCAQKKQL
jgi:hypothetical protein